jgi:hypothetical protein
MTTRLRVLTNSERRTRACLRAWWFRYLVGLGDIDSAAPLRQGTLLHRLLAATYRFIRDTGERMPPIELADEVIGPWLEARESWLATQDPAWAEAALEDDRAIAAQSREMWLGYIGHWCLVDDWEILLVEDTIARPIFVGAGIQLSHQVRVGDAWEMREWVLGGSVDLVVRDRSDGRVYLVEHKSTAEKDFESYVRKLHWDPQIRTYPWILRAPINREPIHVDGVIYNVLRKAVPRIPAQNKDGQTSRAAIDTTPEIYERTLRERGQDPDDYRDQIERLRGNWYFQRERYLVTDRDLADFERDLVDDATRARDDSLPGATYPRQTAVCTGPAAYRCAYAEPCIEDGPDVRRNYRVMGIRHAELEGDYAEPWVAQERGLTLANDSPAAQVNALADAFGKQAKRR